MELPSGHADGAAPYSGPLLGVECADEAAYRQQRFRVGVAEGPDEMPSGVPLALHVRDVPAIPAPVAATARDPCLSSGCARVR